MAKIEKNIVIKNKLGLHARPATVFVQTASKFDSSVHIRIEDELLDGKSIMNILSLGLEAGSNVFLIVEGEDAELAMVELTKILESEEDN